MPIPTQITLQRPTITITAHYRRATRLHWAYRSPCGCLTLARYWLDFVCRTSLALAVSVPLSALFLSLSFSLSISLQRLFIHRSLSLLLRYSLTRSSNCSVSVVRMRRTYSDSMSNIPIIIIIIAPLRVNTLLLRCNLLGCLCCRLVVKRTSFRTVLCVVVVVILFFLYLHWFFFAFASLQISFWLYTIFSFHFISLIQTHKRKEKLIS